MAVPVLLVPGWSDRAAQLQRLRSAFVSAGWPDAFVHALEFHDRFGSNIAHASEISAAVERLRAQTCTERVDVVAHSMGGLALRYYLHFHGGAAAVRKVVFTGTPHRGTWLAWLARGAGAREMRPGHELLRILSEVSIVPAGVTALAIQTPTEARVWPRSSALLHEGRNMRVWCLSHAGMMRSSRVFSVIRAFLDE